MRKRLFLAAIACMSIGIAGVQAQTALKIGYADVDYILSNMPEARQVQADLESHGNQLQNQMKAKEDEFTQKLEAYQKGQATMIQEIRQEKEAELTQLRQRIQTFQQSAQASLQKKQGELMQPLYEKVGDAIEAVAKENAFTYVLNGNVGGIDVILYTDPKNDVSDLVLKKMGITPPPAE